jgi:hypothetical protein
MAAEVTEKPLSAAALDDPEHVVHPAGQYDRAGFRWGYFLVLNGISAVAAIAVFIAIAYGDALDPFMMGTYRWLLAHPLATSAMAFSPLASSGLVGWGYSQRARKRKAAAAAALAGASKPAADEVAEAPARS